MGRQVIKRPARAKASQLAVEHWPIDRLKAYAKNARTHSKEQVDQIAASMREFGFVNPVGVDRQGTLIWGHGRILAAAQLGMATVPVIRLGHLSDAQARALRIADNQIALNAGWDLELLKFELLELKGAGEVAGAQIHIHPRKFGQEAKSKPPFPSDPHYDAKAWEMLTARKGPGRVVFWNVTGPAD
jgi:hypothetical protein